MIGRRCELCGSLSIVGRMCLNRESLCYGSHRENDDVCPCFSMRPATRQDLVEAWQGIDTLLCAMAGQAPEMTDKEAAQAMSRALWVILNWIVRGIDKERSESNVQEQRGHL